MGLFTDINFSIPFRKEVNELTGIVADGLMFEKQTSWFREFHRFPELSMKEYRTTQRIKEILAEMGISLLPYSGETGLVAIIEGNGTGPEIVLRTDIDALPIQELSDLPYKSTIPGISHMCGHDFHMSVVLGSAMQLVECRDQWRGTVKLLFQPGEETTQGAKYMLERGVLTGSERAIFGLHNAPQLPAGTIGIRKGPFFASADTLHIAIKGKKGHAAMPHLTIDATVAASAIVMALQTVVSRNVNPLESAVVTIGSFHSGHTHNVVSDLTEMLGTMRAFTKETRSKLYEAVTRTVESVAKGYGAEAVLQILPQTPSVYNDFEVTEHFIRSAAKVLPQERILETDLVMAAEDFALYQERIPGCYFLIGTQDASKGIVESWHHPAFMANESVLPLASRLLVQAALDLLEK